MDKLTLIHKLTGLREQIRGMAQYDDAECINIAIEYLRSSIIASLDVDCQKTELTLGAL